jgi:outer membrane immunogenic protein
MRIKSFSVATLLFSMSSLAVLAADPISGYDPIMPEMSVSTETDWTGFYAGVFSGYTKGEVTADTVPSGFAGLPLTWAQKGALAGVTAGYNHQIDQFVFGVEGDIAWADVTSRLDGVTPTLATNMSWMGTLRGRAGVAIDQFMLFGTAGIAVGSVNATSSPPFVGTTGTDTQTLIGWTVGLGAEYAATENIRLKAEYSYIDFGSMTTAIGTLHTSRLVRVDSTAHALKVGVNFAFN